MGLEEYIRARSDQYHGDIHNIHSAQQHQRNVLADRPSAGNGIIPSRFIRPSTAFQYGEAQSYDRPPPRYDLPYFPPQQQQQQYPLAEKSIFDTDIENADDTTLTVASIVESEARGHASRTFGQNDVSQAWEASVLSESESESDHQFDRNNYHQAITVSRDAVTPSKTPRKSTLAKTINQDPIPADVYEDHGRRTPDWDSANPPRSSTAASNKRNSLANVSRIPQAKSRLSLQRSDSDPGLRSSQKTTKEPEAATRMIQLPHRTSYSKATNFPQSLATTPNNRFNFKSERSYERLISQHTSPTRQVSGPRPQPHTRQQQQQKQQQKQETKNHKQRQQTFSRDDKPRRHSTSPEKMAPRKKLDLSRGRRFVNETDDSDANFDDESGANENAGETTSNSSSSSSSIHAPSLTTTTDLTQRKISVSTTTETIDHRYEKLKSDYPDHILQEMDFSELEKEPFDHSPGGTGDSSFPNHNPLSAAGTSTKFKARSPSPPPPPPPPPPISSPPDANASPSEKLAYVMTALPDPAARHRYISALNIADWESLGDELLDQMGEMLKMIKDSRQARRRTTSLFETEIRRRHDETMRETGELDKKLTEMKEGGLGVLRALQPT